MFGNRLGWGISAVICMFAAFLANLVYQAARVSAPTGWVPRTIQPLTTAASAQTLVPDITEPRDAGELYRRAIDDYLANRAAYDALATAKDLNPVAITARPGLVALLEATRCATMKLFTAQPQEVVRYDADKPPLDALHQVGKVALRIALLSAASDPVAARKYYEAVFSLGLKLYQERIVFGELSLGEELMGTAAAGMKSLAERSKDAERVRLIQQFDTDRLNEHQAKLQPVWAVISSIDEGTIAKHAGDLFVLAQERGIDRLWRVEATLKLGRLGYLAGRRGDQLAAMRVLREMSQDPGEDPIVKLAAERARALTIEEYRMLR